MTDEQPSRPARPLGPPQAVPVFNCIVYLARLDSPGCIVARCANLPEVTSTGASEREALQRIVAAFKNATAGYVSRGEAIPFVVPPPKLVGESERLIAVHL